MNILISGDPQTVIRLLQEAARAVEEEGTFSIDVEDEKERPLSLAFEGTDNDDPILWEQS